MPALGCLCEQDPETPTHEDDMDDMDKSLDRNPLAVAFIAGLDKAQEQYHAYGNFPSPTGRVELAQDAYPNDDDGDEAANIYVRGRNDALRELTATLPQTTDQARAAAHAALLRWQGLADEARRAAWTADQHALGGDGLRVRCADDLVEEGQSRSAADKAASNHPDYLEHKAEARRLNKAKADAEHLRDVAFQTLQNHREYLRERTVATTANATATAVDVLGTIQRLRAAGQDTVLVAGDPA